MTEEVRKETKTLYSVINDAIEQRLSNVHTAIPGEIVNYDYATNLATVKATLKRKYQSEDISTPLPLITHVPVAFPRMGGAHIRFPVSAGQEGLLIFCERSIDKWLDTGGVVDPDDTRKFSFSDAIFIPGVASSVNPIESDAAQTSLEIKIGDAYIEITADKKFKVTNGTEELLSLISNLIQAILDARTNTSFGPQPLVPPSSFTAVKTKIDSMKG